MAAQMAIIGSYLPMMWCAIRTLTKRQKVRAGAICLLLMTVVFIEVLFGEPMIAAPAKLPFALGYTIVSIVKGTKAKKMAIRVARYVLAAVIVAVSVAALIVI